MKELEILSMDEIKPMSYLYGSSVLLLCLGVFLIYLDILYRCTQPDYLNADSIIELWEWNLKTDWGLLLIAFSLWHFLLGLRIDIIFNKTNNITGATHNISEEDLIK